VIHPPAAGDRPAVAAGKPGTFYAPYTVGTGQRRLARGRAVPCRGAIATAAKTDWENRRLPLSLTVYVIVDLEFPRYGLIRVDAADEVRNDLRKSMQ
jgi:hypothetical protein